ncbi:MAG TPA: methyltransferase domain-containing protein [Streptosporangiaceae bacterium]|jgi:protein-L-isoaspartate(D-aspartate) O-methyltransferase
MLGSEPFWQAEQGDCDPAGTARARLAGALRESVQLSSDYVLAAFAQVPRHLFVPEVAPPAAYRDEALIIKCDPDGLPVSSSSQPAMMAIMLDQLDLRPGHRVLEIGTGSGYNAAVMSAVTGPSGSVTSVDIDPELVARARSSLVAAGYGRVAVRCADGGYGDSAGAPYDRIIVTAGAWDVAPAWLGQLRDTGRLVLPLSIRGIQLSIALERRGAGWVSTSAFRCGFVRMLGAFAGPQAMFRLTGPDGLYVQIADGQPADEAGLQAALAGPAAEEPVALAPVSLAELADLDLWLTLTQPDLDRVTLLAAPDDGRPRLAPLLPFGGLVSAAAAADQVGIAMLMPTDLIASGTGQPQVVARGYGPGGRELAVRVAGLGPAWAEQGRPGTGDLDLVVRQRAAGPGPAAGVARAGLTVVLERPSVTIEAGWPMAGAAGRPNAPAAATPRTTADA